MPRILTTLLLATLCNLAPLAPLTVHAAPETPERGARIDDWARLTDDRSRTEIAYPGSVFVHRPTTPGAEGHVLLSRDRRARLLIGWFTNDSAASLKDYRAQILEDNYRGAELDYAPTGNGWFVVSGTMGPTMFYERVSFTCDGRFINTWAMLYPVAERQFYDRVVEAIAPTFQPGRGASGRCE